MGTYVNPSGNVQLHPREYVQQHKVELETWEAYSWKQALNAFDDLKDAWERRKQEIGSQMAYYGVQQGLQVVSPISSSRSYFYRSVIAGVNIDAPNSS